MTFVAASVAGDVVALWAAPQSDASHAGCAEQRQELAVGILHVISEFCALRKAALGAPRDKAQRVDVTAFGPFVEGR